MMGAPPQTPGIYRRCLPEWMLFALPLSASALQSKCLIGGQGNAGMRPERRFKPEWMAASRPPPESARRSI
jgi:hypothetical protein